MTPKSKKDPHVKRVPSSLAAWADVICKAGEQSRQQEEERGVFVGTFLADLRAKNPPLREHVQALLKAHDENGLRTTELLDELRRLTSEVPCDHDMDTDYEAVTRCSKCDHVIVERFR